MDEIVDVAGAAAYLGKSERAVRRYFQQGKLPGQRIGDRAIAFRMEDVRNFTPAPRGRPWPKKPKPKKPKPKKKRGKPNGM